MDDDLVYIPRVGFRSAHALCTAEKHMVQREGKTFTAELAPTRDGCRLSVTIAGIDVTPLDDGLRVSRRGEQTIWMNFSEDDHRLPDGRTIAPVSFLIE